MRGASRQAVAAVRRCEAARAAGVPFVHVDGKGHRHVDGQGHRPPGSLTSPGLLPLLRAAQSL
ncbi:hypothetical protein [Streptomyces sp. NPDC046942]|uniref:hypothetical protein n=1 Tax=Streptomyces sp. NPDC046942 TaxID=3155137 RepID=UPI003400CE0A